MLCSRMMRTRGHLLRNLVKNQVGHVNKPPVAVAALSLSQGQERTYLSVGYKAEALKTFTEEDVKLFADLTGDQNPLHTDEE